MVVLEVRMILPNKLLMSPNGKVGVRLGETELY